jgi:hypothetical protein
VAALVEGLATVLVDFFAARTLPDLDEDLAAGLRKALRVIFGMIRVY